MGDDFFDIYSDHATITRSGAGLTLTLRLTQPPIDEGAPEEGVTRTKVIGRVRMSREFADALMFLLARSLAMTPEAFAQKWQEIEGSQSGETTPPT